LNRIEDALTIYPLIRNHATASWKHANLPEKLILRSLQNLLENTLFSFTLQTEVVLVVKAALLQFKPKLFWRKLQA